MVAALNSWRPDGQIWRSTDSGTTWSALWAWADSPNRDKYYSWDTSLAPWLSSLVGDSQVGWMMEALVIDPFDSDHWLYGTGASIWGGHDLTNWDTKHNVTLKSLADGVEETAVLALISPPTGPNLFSGLGDIGGFAHADLDKAPSTAYTNPTFGNTDSLDYAGNIPNTIVRPRYDVAILTLIDVQVRIGNADRDKTTRKIALSYDSGASWSEDYDAALGVSGGAVGISADADTILWRDAETNTVKYSHGASAFIVSIGVPAGAAIASDKKVKSLR
jgi:xyloglucan-specific exo-beta-1,4-glucanase